MCKEEVKKYLEEAYDFIQKHVNRPQELLPVEVLMDEVEISI